MRLQGVPTTALPRQAHVIIPWMTIWSYQVSKLWAWRAETGSRWCAEDETLWETCLEHIRAMASY